MLAAPLAMSLFALVATVDAPSVPFDAKGAPLAQVEGAAPPAPLDEPAPAALPDAEVAPPAAQSPEATGDDATGPRARTRERRKQRQAEATGIDPLMTTGLQIGAGALTCGVCLGGYCGASLLVGASLGLLLTPLGLPLVTALVTGVIDGLLCGAVGLSVGSVEVLVGNLFGAEEGDWLWPALAGAGIGAGASLVGTAASLALPFTGYQPPELMPGDTVALDDLAALSNPAALALQMLSLGACVLGCAAMPIVPALIYGLTAEPKATLQSTAVELESVAPAFSSSRTAMAY